MYIMKNIFFVTTIVAVLSVGECDNRLKIQRFKRHDTSIRIKRTSYAPPPPVPFDYSDNADGFYVLDLKLSSLYCYSGEPNCAPYQHKWIISDFKFQLYNEKNPCHNTSITLNPEKISTIQKSIQEKWSSDLRSTQIDWKLSGSCSLRIPELDDEFKFFKKSIDLYDKFNIGKILDDEGITVKGDYSIDKISDAISNALGGKHAQLGCLNGNDPLNEKRDGVDQFEEVIIFFDKQFNPIDNPGWQKYIFGECPRNVIVHYGVDSNNYY
ncbi:uncharacterized protein LOC123270044 [Cotesia glomerata]|uniref:uncharacterized protein LOC123270044 n=1 Tax=Cotesia glomerata TaxID=32391 RepID=UPI001D017809|nr:uncharacterized protein LOC123270044 [Cotesia glomerata]